MDPPLKSGSDAKTDDVTYAPEIMQRFITHTMKLSRKNKAGYPSWSENGFRTGKGVWVEFS